MYTFQLPRLIGTLALFAACNFSAHAQEIKTVFVIAMENHNWTQPANQSTGGIQQIFQNPNAPFINSLVDGTAWAEIGGRTQHITEQVAYEKLARPEPRTSWTARQVLFFEGLASPVLSTRRAYWTLPEIKDRAVQNPFVGG